VHRDSTRREHRSQRLRERVRRRLAGRVAGHRRRAREAQQREDVDDLAAAVSLEHGDEGADGRVGALVVDGNLATDCVRVGVEGARELRRRRVVDQQRGVAAAGGRGVDRGDVGEVERDGDNARILADGGGVAREGVDLRRAQLEQRVDEVPAEAA
jgi:hypothetical protein